jgi:hypothetical protein
MQQWLIFKSTFFPRSQVKLGNEENSACLPNPVNLVNPVQKIPPQFLEVPVQVAMMVA